MAIASIRDVRRAFALGKTHLQCGFKNTGVTGDGLFQDWAYVGGFPSINPRIGTALTWTPQIAEKNQAIYFPQADVGEDIILTEWGMRTAASSTNQAATICMLFDLLGYYPLIDGDSTDVQELEGAGLPRYVDGNEVRMCLVNHLVPQSTSCVASLTYTDTADVSRVTSFGVQNNGQNKICSSLLTAAGAVSGAASYAIPMVGTCHGAKSAQSIKFITAPGGLFCLYFFRPLGFINTVAPVVIDNARSWAITDFGLEKGLNFPRIYNGAHLSFFHIPVSTGRSSSCHYQLQFAWG